MFPHPVRQFKGFPKIPAGQYQAVRTILKGLSGSSLNGKGPQRYSCTVVDIREHTYRPIHVLSCFPYFPCAAVDYASCLNHGPDKHFLPDKVRAAGICNVHCRGRVVGLQYYTKGQIRKHPFNRSAQGRKDGHVFQSGPFSRGLVLYHHTCDSIFHMSAYLFQQPAFQPFHMNPVRPKGRKMDHSRYPA